MQDYNRLETNILYAIGFAPLSIHLVSSKGAAGRQAGMNCFSSSLAECK